MTPDSEEETVIELGYLLLVANGEWPTLRAIHRRLQRQGIKDVDVREASRRINPAPILRYADLGERLVLGVPSLARLSAARSTLDDFVACVQLAYRKYIGEEGEGDVTVTSSELKETLAMETESLQVTWALLDVEPAIRGNSMRNDDGWSFEVSDEIIVHSETTSLATYIDVRESLVSGHALNAQVALKRHQDFLKHGPETSGGSHAAQVPSEPETNKRFDVAISFAAPERDIARILSDLMTDAGYDVAFDELLQAELWGTDLPSKLDTIFRTSAKHCVVFVSKAYAERVWPRYELRSAVERNIANRELGYILPIRVDNTRLPGLHSSIGYLSLKDRSIEEIATVLVAKLGGAQPYERGRQITGPMETARVPAARAVVEHEFRQLAREMQRWATMEVAGGGVLTLYLDIPRYARDSTDSARITLGPLQQRALLKWQGGLGDLRIEAQDYLERLDEGDSVGSRELRRVVGRMQSSLHQLRSLLD